MKNNTVQKEKNTTWIASLLAIKNKLQKQQPSETLEVKKVPNFFPEKPWRPGEECIPYA